MNDPYALVLAVEGAVVFASGTVITGTAARNPAVVLYSEAVVLMGGGVLTGGLAAMLLGVGASDLASGLVIVAALAFLAAGWRLAVDGFDVENDIYVRGTENEESGGFDE